jgi:hypothetical protein
MNRLGNDTMNTEEKIRALAAEMLALETVISRVLDRISRLDPVLAAAIRAGFEDAADDLESLATKSGQTTSSKRAVKALAVIETLRPVHQRAKFARRLTTAKSRSERARQRRR